MSRIIFITGTDTGTGKTLLTSLLLAYLRQRGINTLAIKPFCSGNRRDAHCLSGLQEGILPLNLVNPWFAKAPVAPGIGLRKSANKPNKNAVLTHIRAMAKRCDLLLVEGAGGLLSPLGEDLDARGIIRALRCPVLVAARNRLGCLNHVLLTAQALKFAGSKRIKIVLMGVGRPDQSARSNAAELRKKPDFTGVFAIPYLGGGAAGQAAVKKNAKKLKKTLALCAGFDIFRPFFAKRR